MRYQEGIEELLLLGSFLQVFMLSVLIIASMVTSLAIHNHFGVVYFCLALLLVSCNFIFLNKLFYNIMLMWI